MLDQDPTQAADLDKLETQSIHAWSQADDAEAVTTYIPQRSWKTPLLYVAALVALLSAGFMGYKINDAADHVGGQHHWNDVVVNPSAAKPQVAPLPPEPQTPDQRFLALLPQRGIKVVSPPLAIDAGHWICEKEKAGFSDPDIAQALVESTPGTNLRSEAIFVDTAREVYCPPN